MGPALDVAFLKIFWFMISVTVIVFIISIYLIVFFVVLSVPIKKLFKDSKVLLKLTPMGSHYYSHTN